MQLDFPGNMLRTNNFQPDPRCSPFKFQVSRSLNLMSIRMHRCALMSKTYPELKSEIARLEAEAERVRQYELPTVIADLNLLIEHYQLTESMIFGNARSAPPGKPKTVMVPRFVDQVTGNTWTGRGSKPAWLSEALRTGTLAENLLVS